MSTWYNTTENRHALVAGAGGFIGGHLVARLLEDNWAVTGVDIKTADDWWQLDARANNIPDTDLSLWDNCFDVLSNEEGSGRRPEILFNLAADMGGMGFIESHKAECMLSVLINTHLLKAAKAWGVPRFFYSSSACVYPAGLQCEGNESFALKESDAYPADSEDGYGWEKLFSERMCRHFTEDYGVATYVARFHNSYGPHGSWGGGREKAPAAICRKVAEATIIGGQEINVWGDGNQLRSFMWIEDNIDGIIRQVSAEVSGPLNIGSAEMVSVNDLVSLVEDYAGVSLTRIYDLSMPKGVHGRCSDNDLIQMRLGWMPSTPLRDGIRQLYDWVLGEVNRSCFSEE